MGLAGVPHSICLHVPMCDRCCGGGWWWAIGFFFFKMEARAGASSRKHGKRTVHVAGTPHIIRRPHTGRRASLNDPVCVWRRIAVTKKWCDLQTLRATNYNLTYFLFALFLIGAKFQNFADTGTAHHQFHVVVPFIHFAIRGASTRNSHPSGPKYMRNLDHLDSRLSNRSPIHDGHPHPAFDPRTQSIPRQTTKLRT
ncbi:hypothetical protein PAPYR_13273 [Paratrimastix pyriformis]|uniref:Uncharacterized protein n=1 Tax=Paratrimastix pyriformis TaxID=342808 RepID=A0ABQ8U0H5_9EUKA|nr:hypothetical protein PAPYR_13273 [Paratrimastix pyriformis]